MVKDLVKEKKHYRTSIADTSEATFTDKYLKSAIDRVLLKDAKEDIHYAMWVYTQSSLFSIILTAFCRLTKRIDKPTNNKKKPDFMIGTKLKKQVVYFFFAEVKRPERNIKYQPEDNFTKLMKQMKASVDEQLRLGVETPKSLGLLIEGILSFCVSCTKSILFRLSKRLILMFAAM